MTPPQSGPAARLVRRLSGHPAGALGIDLGAEGGPERWLVAACLLSFRGGEAAAARAFAALAGAGLDAPAALAARPVEDVASALEDARLPRPAAAARVLARASRQLARDYGGSLDALAAGADDVFDLGARVAALAPGVGAATVARLLRPLRDRWPAAAEVPLAAAARAAAAHLGLIAAGQDEEGEPGALRAALAREPGAPPLADVEAALERLGARACLRERPDRCPLEGECPLVASPR